MNHLLERYFLPEKIQKLVIFTYEPSIRDALSPENITLENIILCIIEHLNN